MDNNQGLQILLHKSVPLKSVIDYLNEEQNFDLVISADMQEEETLAIDIGTTDSLKGKVLPMSVSDEIAREILQFFYKLLEKGEVKQGTFQLIPYEF